MGCSSSKDKVLSINEDGTVNQAKPRLANGIAPKPQSASLETVTSTPVRATPEGIPAAVEVPSPGFVSGPQATPGFGDTLRRKADSDEALSTDAPSAISAAPSDGSSGRSGKSGAYDVHGAFDAYVLADFEAEVEGVEISVRKGEFVRIEPDGERHRGAHPPPGWCHCSKRLPGGRIASGLVPWYFLVSAAHAQMQAEAQVASSLADAIHASTPTGSRSRRCWKLDVTVRRGANGALGIDIDERNRVRRIVHAQENIPGHNPPVSQDQRLRVGDRIVAIDGISLDGGSLTDRISASKDSFVFSVRRPDMHKTEQAQFGAGILDTARLEKVAKGEAMHDPAVAYISAPGRQLLGQVLPLPTAAAAAPASAPVALADGPQPTEEPLNGAHREGRQPRRVRVRRTERGLGIDINKQNVIVALLPGMAAAEDALLQVGDLVTAVDGVQLNGRWLPPLLDAADGSRKGIFPIKPEYEFAVVGEGWQEALLQEVEGSNENDQGELPSSLGSEGIYALKSWDMNEVGEAIKASLPASPRCSSERVSPRGASLRDSMRDSISRIWSQASEGGQEASNDEDAPNIVVMPSLVLPANTPEIDIGRTQQRSNAAEGAAHEGGEGAVFAISGGTVPEWVYDDYQKLQGGAGAAAGAAADAAAGAAADAAANALPMLDAPQLNRPRAPRRNRAAAVGTAKAPVSHEVSLNGSPNRSHNPFAEHSAPSPEKPDLTLRRSQLSSASAAPTEIIVDSPVSQPPPPESPPRLSTPNMRWEERQSAVLGVAAEDDDEDDDEYDDESIIFSETEEESSEMDESGAGEDRSSSSMAASMGFKLSFENLKRDAVDDAKPCAIAHTAKEDILQELLAAGGARQSGVAPLQGASRHIPQAAVDVLARRPPTPREGGGGTLREAMSPREGTHRSPPKTPAIVSTMRMEDMLREAMKAAEGDPMAAIAFEMMLGRYRAHPGVRRREGEKMAERSKRLEERNRPCYLAERALIPEGIYLLHESHDALVDAGCSYELAETLMRFPILKFLRATAEQLEALPVIKTISFSIDRRMSESQARAALYSLPTRFKHDQQQKSSKKGIRAEWLESQHRIFDEMEDGWETAPELKRERSSGAIPGVGPITTGEIQQLHPAMSPQDVQGLQKRLSQRESLGPTAPLHGIVAPLHGIAAANNNGTARRGSARAKQPPADAPKQFPLREQLAKSGSLTVEELAARHLPTPPPKSNARGARDTIGATRTYRDTVLKQKIGQGTYGLVYKGECREEEVAVKVMLLQMDTAEDIKREIKIMRECECPHIVAYRDAFIREHELRSTLWVVMEFCHVGSALDVMRHQGRPLEEPHVAWICHGVLHALDYLHTTRKTIHRDVKAANVLITRNGDVKLADLGVAAQLYNTMSKRGTMIGTPHWMAPETLAQASVSGDMTNRYDTKVDVWGVGITAIEMAQMQPPLADSRSVFQVMMHIVNGDPPALLPDVDATDTFHSFLADALIKEPSQRPSAAELCRHQFITSAHPRALFELAEQHLRTKAESVASASGRDEPEDGRVLTAVVDTLGSDRGGTLVV